MNSKLLVYSKTSRFYGDKEAARKIIAHLKRRELVSAVKVLSWWFSQQSWRFSPLQLYERHVSRNFDKNNGTDTTTRANLPDLTITGGNRHHGVYYQASPVYSLKRIIRSLNIDVRDFTFVDYGSGKGRTLLVASEFPFRKVIGVEFAKELHETAVSNINTYGKTRAAEIESVLADATEYTLPEDNLVVYFFNPFDEELLSRVLDKIARDMPGQDRELFVIYRYLPNKQLFMDRGTYQFLRRWWAYTVFRWGTH